MSNRRAYYAYLFSTTAAGLLFATVFTTAAVYRVEIALLNPLQLILVGTALELSVFLFEIPTGVVADLYSRPQLLWIFCPLLLYWITRIWHLAWRGKMHDDPLEFAFGDFQTLLVGAIGVAAMLFAI